VVAYGRSGNSDIGVPRTGAHKIESPVKDKLVSE